MGAYICTISERDWDKARQLGVYGNRFYFKEEGKELRDSEKLSIIRDLVSIREKDVIFFHVRGRKTIHGVYIARSQAIWDEEKIWEDEEPFPCRFLFEPHPKYKKLCRYDVHITVESLYELIDQGKIKSLVTLEFEQRLEARAVRRIFEEDANEIIRLLYRDFDLKNKEKKSIGPLYNPREITPLKNKIYRVGELENAIKAVISWKLANKDKDLIHLLGIDEPYDFVNEFFVAPTTRKNIDFLCKTPKKYIVIEVKTGKCGVDALKQALYYADLLKQRPWVNREKEKLVVLIGKKFSSSIKHYAKIINDKIKVNTKVKLIRYKPTEDKKWAELYEEQIL